MMRASFRPRHRGGLSLGGLVCAVVLGCVAFGGRTAEAQFGMGGIGIGVGVGGGFRGVGPSMGMGSIGPGAYVGVGGPGFYRPPGSVSRGGTTRRSPAYTQYGTRVRRGPRRW
jgi:hypothetical protein